MRKNIKDLEDGTLTVGGGTDLQVSQAEVKDATLKLAALEKQDQQLAETAAEIPVLFRWKRKKSLCRLPTSQ